MWRRSIALVMVAMSFGGCVGANLATKQPTGDRREDARLLACLGAPSNAIYDPERLVAGPAPGLSVRTFGQVDGRCGPLRRR